MNAYTGLAPSYDALTGDVDYAAYLAFYQRMFRETGTEVASVLDLGCGTGTLTLLLAEAGYDLIGVDAQPEMLMEAMDKVGEADVGERVLLLNQRMEELDLYGTVDAAVSSLDCLNYVEPSLLPEVFRRLRLFIRPGGLLIFDVLSPEGLRQMDGETYCDEQEGVFCVWRAAYDEESNCCRYLLDCFTRQTADRYRRSTEEHVEFAHEPTLLERLLRNNGFPEVRIMNGNGAGVPGQDSRRLFFICRRN